MKTGREEEEEGEGGGRRFGREQLPYGALTVKNEPTLKKLINSTQPLPSEPTRISTRLG